MYIPVRGRHSHKKRNPEAYWGTNPGIGLPVSLQKNRDVNSFRSLRKNS